MSHPVKIYIDGVCRKSRGPGAWGVILTKGTAQKEISGSEVVSTQNQAEMKALVVALSALSRPCLVEILTSSEYLVNGTCRWLEGWKQNGWKTRNQQPVKNADLWMQVDELIQRHSVVFTQIPVNEKNNLERRANKLANKGLDELTKQLKDGREAVKAAAHLTPDGVAIEPVRIYTDGSWLKDKHGTGGWGAVIVSDGQDAEISGSAFDTTSNRMEMQAVIEGLLAAPAGVPAKITTDSKYVKKGMEEWVSNWKQSGWVTSDGEPVKNQDLWQQLDELCAQRHITWRWVKGHNGHQYNEKADSLARAASAGAAKAHNIMKFEHQDLSPAP